MFYNMTTLGEIVDIRQDTNLCQVHVPIFDAAGNKTEFRMWATMMLPPGIHSGYEINDVVFITFADNSLNRPIVLGQLYRGGEGTKIGDLGDQSDKLDRATKFSCNDLDACGKVHLPMEAIFTNFSGTVVSGTSKTFKSLWDDHRQLRNDHDKLREDYDQLRNDHDKLGEDHGQLRNDYDKLREDHDQLRVDHTELKNSYTQLSQQLANLTSKVNSQVQS